MTGRLFTARDVAEILGVHPETILCWVRDRKLPAIRLPSGAIRIREDELDAWLDERATRGAGRSLADALATNLGPGSAPGRDARAEHGRPG